MQEQNIEHENKEDKVMNITTPFDDFGSLVFDEKLMEERLPNPVYKTWK